MATLALPSAAQPDVPTPLAPPDPPPPPPPPPPAPVGAEASKLTEPATQIAVFVVLAWVVMLFWLLACIDDGPETVWSRKQFVLNSLEAVAFAAAGALLGTTIQQKRVQKAEDEARQAQAERSQAEAQARANVDGAVKGRVLASALKQGDRATRQAAPLANDRVLEASGPSSAEAVELRQLRRLAESLFPG